MGLKTSSQSEKNQKQRPSIDTVNTFGLRNQRHSFSNKRESGKEEQRVEFLRRRTWGNSPVAISGSIKRRSLDVDRD